MKLGTLRKDLKRASCTSSSAHAGDAVQQKLLLPGLIFGNTADFYDVLGRSGDLVSPLNIPIYSPHITGN